MSRDKRFRRPTKFERWLFSDDLSAGVARSKMSNQEYTTTGKRTGDFPITKMSKDKVRRILGGS